MLDPDPNPPAAARYEAPCVGLDPDTNPCPFCGAWLGEPCKKEKPDAT